MLINIATKPGDKYKLHVVTMLFFHILENNCINTLCIFFDTVIQPTVRTTFKLAVAFFLYQKVARLLNCKKLERKSSGVVASRYMKFLQSLIQIR
jgi:hypothetical protein